MINNLSDPRRPDRIQRYIAPSAVVTANNDRKDVVGEDLTPDYMNVLGMIFSMCALMLRIKWCSWVAVYCSCISFANTKYNDDTKQIMSSFMLSISAVVMSYLQNPSPMPLPFSAWFQSKARYSPAKFNAALLFSTWSQSNARHSLAKFNAALLCSQSAALPDVRRPFNQPPGTSLDQAAQVLLRLGHS